MLNISFSTARKEKITYDRHDVKHFISNARKRDDHIRPSYVTLVLAYDDVSFARAHHTSPTIWQSKQAQLVAFGFLHFFPKKKFTLEL
jgi:hypothetical protein